MVGKTTSENLQAATKTWPITVESGHGLSNVGFWKVTKKFGHRFYVIYTVLFFLPYLNICSDVLSTEYTVSQLISDLRSGNIHEEILKVVAISRRIQRSCSTPSPQ